MQAAKDLVSLCICTGSPEPSLLADAILVPKSLVLAYIYGYKLPMSLKTNFSESHLYAYFVHNIVLLYL